MPKYLLRKNCEYTLLVDALDENQAIDRAEEFDLEDWDRAWSQVEAEEETEENTDG